ncbi:uncharacterized protein MELLADRAFT_66161 [Melampsora larici-populina 98AG31]|uniref:Uncharacterized protein n=1 Tax=Melampsora larici-populina (strain 98AG31 / pathotype 3-4-7) TaxID=747676 RepID=F4RY39_MELLP|nr:uncharacterized protein MELLADRAFT_66161 [Melampsora larici-populina 98AG31]EGG02707.1 hypothetical protein MELLADRAFT_66161 [Melampsora larici-populina 98AG31]
MAQGELLSLEVRAESQWCVDITHLSTPVTRSCEIAIRDYKYPAPERIRVLSDFGSKHFHASPTLRSYHLTLTRMVLTKASSGLLRSCQQAGRATSTSLRNPDARRHYARLTLIGNLVQDAKVIERGADRDPMIALKIATSDPIGREAREAGKAIYPTAQFKLSLMLEFPNCIANTRFLYRSLVLVQADVRMQPQEHTEAGYQPAIVRLTLREATKLRNPKTE